MSNPGYFQDRLDRLGQRMEEINSAVINFVRPQDFQITGVNATIGSTRLQETSDTGMLIEYDTRDYIVPVEELIHPVDGTPVIPQRGDVIVETTGNQLECTLMSMRNDPPFRYTTQSRKRMRIHTKVTVE